MKKYLIIICCLLLCSCYKDEYLGNTDQNNNTYEYAYLYDNDFKDYSYCQVIGSIKCDLDKDYHSINRSCDIIDGYIRIGTTNVFYINKTYDGYLNIIVDNKVIKSYRNFILVRK